MSRPIDARSLTSDHPLRRILALCVSVLYALVVAVAIILLSGSPYNFMIGENDNGRKMTACDLPTPSDDVSGLYTMATGVLVLPVTGLVRLFHGRRLAPSMVLGVALLALWAYEFFGKTLTCSAPIAATTQITPTKLVP